jgi:hypothetical protein
MGKLNQVLAVVKGEKEKTYQNLTKAHHGLQKVQMLAGISKTYKPKDEDGDKYPDESTRVQTKAHRAIEQTEDVLGGYWDLVATRDWANTHAKADIVLHQGTEHEQVVLKDVPASYLLWLEKELRDMYTFVSKLPVLSTDEEWEFDQNVDCYRSKSFESTKMKKIHRPLVKYEATKEHPAQVDMVQEDQIIGYWTTTKFSGALPAERVEQLKTRVRDLQKAVKFARERANSTDVTQQRVAHKIFGYLFAK